MINNQLWKCAIDNWKDTKIREGWYCEQIRQFYYWESAAGNSQKSNKSYLASTLSVQYPPHRHSFKKIPQHLLIRKDSCFGLPSTMECGIGYHKQNISLPQNSPKEMIREEELINQRSISISKTQIVISHQEATKRNSLAWRDNKSIICVILLYI